MKFGLARPVKKTTAFDFQPVLLMNVVHTNSDGLKDEVRDRQVMIITKKEVMDRITKL